MLLAPTRRDRGGLRHGCLALALHRGVSRQPGPDRAGARRGPGTPTATRKIGRIATRSPPVATGRRTRPCTAASVEWPKARIPERSPKKTTGSGTGRCSPRAWPRVLRVRPNLAGYRDTSVYIQRSMHVPPSPPAVRDAMPAFFDLLRDEPEPSVRVVLGHFLFVHIRPGPDGNGRIGRFLMNVMLAAAGWPWTIIPVERRDEYMAALEAASGDRWRGRLAIPLRGIAGAPASAASRLMDAARSCSSRREFISHRISCDV